MPHLIIMRHAKSIDRSQSDDDFDRGLTERGREDARHVASLLKEHGLTADLALVSPALRTLQTWQQIAEAMGSPDVQSPMSLYHASEDMLWRAIKEAYASGSQNVVLVGHNPGIGALAHEMGGLADSLAGWPWGWPTSAVAVFEIEIDQVNPEIGQAKQVLMHNPKA